jgi:hypothetical protein
MLEHLDGDIRAGDQQDGGQRVPNPAPDQRDRADDEARRDGRANRHVAQQFRGQVEV